MNYIIRGITFSRGNLLITKYEVKYYIVQGNSVKLHCTKLVAFMTLYLNNLCFEKAIWVQ